MSSRRNNLGPHAEIADLVEQLSRLNGQLKRKLPKMGTRQDTKEFRAETLALRNDGKKVCKQVMELLRANRHGNPAVVSKLKRDFEKVLNAFTAVSRDMEAREEQIVVAISASQQASSPIQDAAASGYGGLQDQAQIDIEFTDYDVQELEQRKKGIQKIETDVQELGEMYRDLQEMVEQQQDGLNLIEDNIVDAHDKVVDGKEQLDKAEELQKSARKKKCCLLVLVLLIIGGIAAVVAVVAK